MRYFSTPDVPCLAICPACTEAAAQDPFVGWSELDPETLEGAQPLGCARCGTRTDA